MTEPKLPAEPERFACEDTYGGCVMSPDASGYWISHGDYNALRSQLTSALARVAEMEGEIVELKQNFDLLVHDKCGTVDRLEAATARAEAAEKDAELYRIRRRRVFELRQRLQVSGQLQTFEEFCEEYDANRTHNEVG